jgi:hypothetical protein
MEWLTLRFHSISCKALRLEDTYLSSPSTIHQDPLPFRSSLLQWIAATRFEDHILRLMRMQRDFDFESMHHQNEILLAYFEQLFLISNLKSKCLFFPTFQQELLLLWHFINARPTPTRMHQIVFSTSLTFDFPFEYQFNLTSGTRMYS